MLKIKDNYQKNLQGSGKKLSKQYLEYLEEEKENKEKENKENTLSPIPKNESDGTPTETDEERKKRLAEEERKRREEEKRQQEAARRKEIFDRWNSKKIIQHRKLTEKIERRINGLLGDGVLQEEILAAIDNYATVLFDARYFFSYKWDLEDFLTRGVKKFIPAMEPLKNFLKEKSPDNGSRASPVRLAWCPKCEKEVVANERFNCTEPKAHGICGTRCMALAPRNQT